MKLEAVISCSRPGRKNLTSVLYNRGFVEKIMETEEESNAAKRAM